MNSDSATSGEELTELGDLLVELNRLRCENASLLELNAALKDSNAALKDANEALKDGNRALKDANEALKGLVASLQREREAEAASSRSNEPPLGVARSPDIPANAVASLPQELLLRIFFATIPPDHHYGCSLARGPRNAWLTSVATRKALTLVCKAWYGPASEALYADIVLRRMGQVSALARTLRAARAIYGSDPSAYVRRVRLVGCPVLGACARVFGEDLAHVLRLCANLDAFESHPVQCPSLDDLRTPESVHKPGAWCNPVWLWGSADRRGTPGAALAERCAAGLRHLVFAEQLSMENLVDVHHFLCVETRLASLSLHAVSATEGILDRMSELPGITLPYLKRLEIDATEGGFLEYVWERWEVENLQQLTLLNAPTIPEILLTRLGLRLRYLHVVPGDKWESHLAQSTLENLSVLCPILDHLVLPSVPTLNLPCVIRSPTLRFLDIWGPAQKQRVLELMCEMGHACGLPALQAIRMLPPHMPREMRAPLPLVCGPEDVRGDEVWVRPFFGTRVVQTSWAVLYDMGGRGGGVKWSSVPWEEESDIESGDEYEPDLEELEEDATSWISDSEAGSEGSDTQTDGEACEEEDETAVDEGHGCGDRDEMLDMFSRGQEEDFLFDDDVDA